MKQYTIRRILQLIPVLLGISILIFAVMKMIPGDVISGILGVEATPELRAQLAAKYGLDRPYIVQYLDWIGGVLRGDFGESIRTAEPILPQILTRFQVTAELTILAAVISWFVAIPLGILAAVKRNSMADRLIRVFALLGVSVPGFALSILLILFLSLAFGYFSPLGYVGFFEDPLRNLQIMILPASILGISISGSVMRMTRSSVLEVLRQDFVRTVRAKGASERVAIFKHVLRSALIPIVTLVGMQIGSLLGGAVIVEQIFSLPGLGQMTLTGINQRDYPVVQGCVLFIAFVYVLVNVVTDLLYAYIDPRISYD
ncbi:ABC transporter permease [Pseudoflavonifractor sp. DSM 107456]|uniref:ABC transporter permease n=2 Tax=Pseudoflavonifractor TaxID=1017280 RepID=A0ABR9RB17_9FIRM|nr:MULTISPECIES: ABC transporter permease [Eubacteriales]MBC5729295.1 ABC transporter permease [Pseudoflavonifractor hominis]MBE5055881.1 ABC transporter permease [Pseudoflavonifractor gallinarum]MBS5136621.1 ABC transporter permease [Oscillospiraceae bacterium]